jgi:hypothetical protein
MGFMSNPDVLAVLANAPHIALLYVAQACIREVGAIAMLIVVLRGTEAEGRPEIIAALGDLRGNRKTVIAQRLARRGRPRKRVGPAGPEGKSGAG